MSMVVRGFRGGTTAVAQEHGKLDSIHIAGVLLKGESSGTGCRAEVPKLAQQETNRALALDETAPRAHEQDAEEAAAAVRAPAPGAEGEVEGGAGASAAEGLPLH